MKTLSGCAIVIALFFALPAAAADSINWTFYGPGAAGNMQGGMTAAKNGPDGGNRIRTLDDVRLGKSKWVTLASANSMIGKWFCLGTVTYTSPLDRKTHTLENVVGYVHDTGCAFNGTCSRGWLPQYASGTARPDKMDIAIGDFSGWGAGPTMNFITRNPNRAASTWQQIAGLPSTNTNQGGACGGEPRDIGNTRSAAYQPPSVTDSEDQRRLLQQYALNALRPMPPPPPPVPSQAYGTSQVSPQSNAPISQQPLFAQPAFRDAAPTQNAPLSYSAPIPASAPAIVDYANYPTQTAGTTIGSSIAPLPIITSAVTQLRAIAAGTNASTSSVKPHDESVSLKEVSTFVPEDANHNGLSDAPQNAQWGILENMKTILVQALGILQSIMRLK